MILQYDIRVVGAATVDKALAGIEARIRQHNAAVAQSVGQTATGGGGGRTRAARAGAAPTSGTRPSASPMAHDDVKVAKLAGDTRERSIKSENALRMRGEREVTRERARGAVEHQRIIDRTAKARSEYVTSTLGSGGSKAINTAKSVGLAGAALVGIGGAGLAASAVQSATNLDAATRRVIISGTGAGETSKYDPTNLRKQFEQTGIQTGQDPNDVAAGVQAYVTKVGDLDTAVANMKTFATVAQATGASIESIASASADMAEKMGVKDVDSMSQALATLTYQGKKGAFELKDMATYFPEVAASAAKFGVEGVKGITDLGGMLQIARQATGSGAEAATSMTDMMVRLSTHKEAIQSGAALGGRKVMVAEGGKKGAKNRGLQDVLADVIVASQGNDADLNKLFGLQGIRAVNPLSAAYEKEARANGGMGTKKGDEAGRAKIVAMMKGASDVKGGIGDIQKDAAEAMKGFGAQMEHLNTELKIAISDELMPALVKLGPELKKLVPYVGAAARGFVDLVSFFLNHPFASMFALVGAQMLADFSKARLAEVAKSFIEGALKRLPVSVGGAGWSGKGLAGSVAGKAPVMTTSVPGTAGTAATGAAQGEATAMAGASLGSSILSGVATGAAIGIPLAAALYAGGIAAYHADRAATKEAGRDLNTVRAMNGPNDADAALEIVKAQREKVLEMQDHEKGLSGVLSDISNFVGYSDSKKELKSNEGFLAEEEAKLQQLIQYQDASKSIQKSGLSLNDAADKLAEAAKRLGITPPNRTDGPTPVKTGA